MVMFPLQRPYKGCFHGQTDKQSARCHISSEKKHNSKQLSNLFSYSNSLQSQLTWMTTLLLLKWLLWINNQRSISPWKIGLDIGWQLRPIWVQLNTCICFQWLTWNLVPALEIFHKTAPKEMEIVLRIKQCSYRVMYHAMYAIHRAMYNSYRTLLTQCGHHQVWNQRLTIENELGCFNISMSTTGQCRITAVTSRDNRVASRDELLSSGDNCDESNLSRNVTDFLHNVVITNFVTNGPPYFTLLML